MGLLAVGTGLVALFTEFLTSRGLQSKFDNIDRKFDEMSSRSSAQVCGPL